MKAICIKWDIDYDKIGLLPTEVEIPDEIATDPEYENDKEGLVDYVSDWLSDTYGYCHEGFVIEE